jgi:heat shock protein HspQ
MSGNATSLRTGIARARHPVSGFKARDSQLTGASSMTKEAVVSVGQLVRHKIFRYRGVVVDVDPIFMLSDDWYERIAKSRPPKDEPWYHILVHDSDQNTYVAQRNLEPDASVDPIDHPALNRHFSGFTNGRYISSQRGN